jgi:hypothetical protein
MIDFDDCGIVGEMKIDRGNRSTYKKAAQCHFVHHKSDVNCSDLEPRKLTIRRLRYNTALNITLTLVTVGSRTSNIYRLQS